MRTMTHDHSVWSDRTWGNPRQEKLEPYKKYLYLETSITKLAAAKAFYSEMLARELTAEQTLKAMYSDKAELMVRRLAKKKKKHKKDS